MSPLWLHLTGTLLKTGDIREGGAPTPCWHLAGAGAVPSSCVPSPAGHLDVSQRPSLTSTPARRWGLSFPFATIPTFSF